MLLNLKIEAEILRKIEQIIQETGQYQDENEFIIRAIKNQIIGESESFTEPKLLQKPDSSLSELFTDYKKSINSSKEKQAPKKVIL